RGGERGEEKTPPGGGPGPEKGPWVGKMGQKPAGVGLPVGGGGQGRAAAVQPLGRKDMRLAPPQERAQHRAAGPDLIGQGRQAERNPLSRIALGLAIERLMLPELLEQ